MVYQTMPEVLNKEIEVPHWSCNKSSFTRDKCHGQHDLVIFGSLGPSFAEKSGENDTKSVHQGKKERRTNSVEYSRPNSSFLES